MADEINQTDAPGDPAAPAWPCAVVVDNAVRFDRADSLSFAITGFLALIVYFITLAPDVTMENSGMLSTGAWYAGVIDPPGSPLWTIYSCLFTRLLPFSNIAWRVGVGSAVAAALASGIVALPAGVA